MPHSKPAAATASKASSATAGPVSDAVADAAAAMALAEGRLPTKAELKLLEAQEEAAATARAFVGDVRIAPNSAV